MSTPPIKRPRRTHRTRLETARAAASKNGTRQRNTRSTKTTSDNPQHNRSGPLSLTAFVSSSLPSGSTHQRAHAWKKSFTDTTRTIELQRAAASLVAHAPAFNTARHIGTIANEIHAAGIDTTRWTGRDIAQALSRHTAENSQIWPTTSDIISPTAFLRYKLAQLDWTGQSPSEHRARADEKRRKEIAARHAENARRDATAASASSRTAARDAFAQHLLKAKMKRPTQTRTENSDMTSTTTTQQDPSSARGNP
jgi:hypothetical protein